MLSDIVGRLAITDAGQLMLLCSAASFHITSTSPLLTHEAFLQAYPKSNAVLVRRHGVYVWGPTWVAAKTQAECYDYLFEAAVKMRGMGIDASKPLAAVPSAPANGNANHGEWLCSST